MPESTWEVIACNLLGPIDNNTYIMWLSLIIIVDGLN